MTLFRFLFWSGCFAFALTAGNLSAQTASAATLQSEKITESWLLSGDPRLVAWGAHDALLAGNRKLIPDLLSLASHWQPLPQQVLDAAASAEQVSIQLKSEQLNQRDGMAAVLDALIQMNVPVPAETLRTLAPDFGDTVAVLLSRMPADEAESLSFDFYRLQSPHIAGLQYVSASVLALHPVPGFAADLLSNVDVRARVYAVLPGAGGFGSGSSGSCGLSGETLRKDWPVTGQYGLSKAKSDGAMLLVAGIDPIYAKQAKSTHYLGDTCSFSWGVDLGPEERRRLIAEMLNISPDAMPWQSDIEVHIEFRSLEQFDRELLAFVAEQQQKYRATAAALAAHGLLTSAEAQQESLPKLKLIFSDMRGEDAIPIPEPSNLPSRVEWSYSPF